MTHGKYENHPGHGTDCPCQIKITPAPYSLTSRGYACWYTGGHCLPGPDCDGKMADYVEEMLSDKPERECPDTDYDLFTDDPD